MSGTAFVTGASRGIGLSLVQQLLRRFPALKVAAASRTAAASPDLAALAEEYPGRLLPTALDMADADSIAAAAAAAVGKDESCPLLFHGAAIMHPSGKGENTVARLDGGDMQAVMSTNVVGPALLTGALWPALRRAGKGTTGTAQAKVVAVGAGVGSIGTNAAGGWYSYRISKTAVNALVKNLAIEGFRYNIVTSCMYPEMVDTAFAAPYVKNNPYPTLRTADETAQRMLELIVDLDSTRSGGFVNIWSNEDIPY